MLLCQQWLEQLPFVDNPAKLLRKLGAYTVSLTRYQLQELAEGGRLQQVRGFWLLRDVSDYDPQKGLQVQGLSEVDYFL